jgi:type I restriction enzyme R subunit
MVGNTSEGLRYGTIGLDTKYYMEWKNDYVSPDANSTEIEKICKELPEKLDRQIFSMFQKARFLDLVRNFVIFKKGRRKACGYNQFFAIKAAQSKIAKKKGGIIWHRKRQDFHDGLALKMDSDNAPRSPCADYHRPRRA